MPSDSTSEKPMTAFSGVRSSWDMLARNSDLWRLAASSCRLLSAISWKSRAFWLASTDCVATVWRGSRLASPDPECPKDPLLEEERYDQERSVTEPLKDRPNPGDVILLLVEDI